VNPDKILAITEIGPIKNIKDVQQLMGCLTTLSQFMSLLEEHGPLLYKLPNKSDSFRWTKEAHKALDELICTTRIEKGIVPQRVYLALVQQDEHHTGG
jgi:hypothetical protein